MENSAETFKVVYRLDRLQKPLLLLLFFIQFLSLISNIFIAKFIAKTLKPNLIYRNQRPIILMANIAFSGFLLNLIFLLAIIFINPFLVDTHLSIASIVQSLMYYILALSLFVISLSMTVLSCDQYFAFTRVFSNPMDNISNKNMLIIIWTPSLLLSVPYFLVNDVYYFGYEDVSIVCYHFNNYLSDLNKNKAFLETTTLFIAIFQYLIPAISISAFFIMIIVDFIKKKYFNCDSYLKIRVIARLITVFTLFIIVNSTFQTDSVRELIYNKQNIDLRPCLVDTYFIYCYFAFFVANLLYPVIYFWMRRDFQDYYLKHFKCYVKRKKALRRKSRPKVYMIA